MCVQWAVEAAIALDLDTSRGAPIYEAAYTAAANLILHKEHVLCEEILEQHQALVRGGRATQRWRQVELDVRGRQRNTGIGFRYIV